MVGDRPIELDLAVGVHQDRAHIHIERMAKVVPHELVRAVQDFIDDYIFGASAEERMAPWPVVDCPDEVERPPEVEQARAEAKAAALKSAAAPGPGEFRSDVIKCKFCSDEFFSERARDRHYARKHAA